MFVMTNFEAWSLALVAVSIIVNLAVFATLAVQLLLLRKQIDTAAAATRADHDRRRMQATLDFEVQSSESQNAWRREGVPSYTDAVAMAAFADPANLDNTLLREYLNWYESLSVGVRLGVYDKRVVYELIGGRTIRTFALVRPWIAALRAAKDRPTVYENTEWLVEELLAMVEVDRAAGRTVDPPPPQAAAGI